MLMAPGSSSGYEDHLIHAGEWLAGSLQGTAAIRPPTSVIVSVVAHPGSSRARVVWDGEALHVWVTAPANEGKANQALTELVARVLGVPRSRVKLLRGAQARSKLIRIDGVESAALDGLRAG